MPMKAPNLLSRFVVKPSKSQQEHLEEVAKAALQNAENQFMKEVHSIVTQQSVPNSDIVVPKENDTETPKNDQIAGTETNDNIVRQKQGIPVSAAVVTPENHEMFRQNEPDKKVSRRLPRNHERQLPQRPTKCHKLEHNNAISLEEFPQNDCILLPNPDQREAQKHSYDFYYNIVRNNIVQIYGRYKSDATKSRKERQLIVDKKPIQLRGEKTCGEYCEEKPDCMCINPQRDVAPFDESSNDMEHGGNDKVAVYVTPPLRGGERHIATIGNVIGFQEMRLFQSVYAINLSGLQNPAKSVFNVLSSELNGNLRRQFSPRGQAVKSMTSIEREKIMEDLPINVVMKLVGETRFPHKKHVVMTAIPIITESGERAKEGDEHVRAGKRSCDVTEVNRSCNLKLHGQWDWEIRIQNVVMDPDPFGSLVHLSANEMPITVREASITVPKFDGYRSHRGYGCGCSFGEDGALGDLDLIFFPMLLCCLLSWFGCCKPREERTLRVFETDSDRPLRERKYAGPEDVEVDDRHIDEIFADIARKDDDIAGDN